MRDEVLAFAGPSLPTAWRQRWPQVAWRPPARAGDGLALLADPPRTVVLIDGLFDQAPSIRHKELLMLMAEGVAVFGAASMGALRAAELSAHGMAGVGAIHAAFERGMLRGDDEVALLHGPAEFDWAPLTLPLVNVRATLLAAVRQRVLTPRQARALLDVAMAVFYQDRTWEAVMDAAETAARDSPDTLLGFSEWLPTGAVDLKRRDAIACLNAAVLRPRGAEPPIAPPPRTLFTKALAASLPMHLSLRDQDQPGSF